MEISKLTKILSSTFTVYREEIVVETFPFKRERFGLDDTIFVDLVLVNGTRYHGRGDKNVYCDFEIRDYQGRIFALVDSENMTFVLSNKGNAEQNETRQLILEAILPVLLEDSGSFSLIFEEEELPSSSYLDQEELEDDDLDIDEDEEEEFEEWEDEEEDWDWDEEPEYRDEYEMYGLSPYDFINLHGHRF